MKLAINLTPTARAAGVLVWGFALAPWSTTLADQGGTPFWLSGQYASLAATPADAGWSVSVTPCYYNGSAGASQAFQRGDVIATGLSSRSPLLMLQPGYAFTAGAFESRIAGVGPEAGYFFLNPRAAGLPQCTRLLGVRGPASHRRRSIFAALNISL